MRWSENLYAKANLKPKAHWCFQAHETFLQLCDRSITNSQGILFVKPTTCLQAFTDSDINVINSMLLLPNPTGYIYNIMLLPL